MSEISVSSDDAPRASSSSANISYKNVFYRSKGPFVGASQWQKRLAKLAAIESSESTDDPDFTGESEKDTDDQDLCLVEKINARIIKRT